MILTITQMKWDLISYCFLGLFTTIRHFINYCYKIIYKISTLLYIELIRPIVSVCSWTESKHECKLHGGWGSVPEGAPPTPVPPVPVDTLQLHGQPLWQLLKHGEQPQQARCVHSLPPSLPPSAEQSFHITFTATLSQS